MNNPNTQPTIQVIDRLAALLDALTDNGGVASLKILTAETRLHPSTAFRILAAAAENGLVERTEHGQYRLGGKLQRWAASLQAGMDLRQVARPIMDWLCAQVAETVNLTVREGDEVVYVERATPKRMMRVEQVIGSRAPLHVTAVGKMMLGAAGTRSVREYAARTGLPAYTRHTLSQPDALAAEAEASYRQGYSLDNEEAELGVGCIGVLIHDRGGTPLAGLSISAPLERRREEWIPLLQEAARRISERLGAAT